MRPTRRHGRRGAPKTSAAPSIVPTPETLVPAPEKLIDEPGALPPDAALPPEPPASDVEHEPVEPLATPEPAFAARVAPPAPEPPLPASRRAIFYDVENASQPRHIARVIEHLAIDRLGRRTEFVAVGNWRVIGPDTGRLLARHGAQLVHSAPSTGVRDWSDLRIAVSAGVWLAAARPGDVLEIVSDDRAFDAVGDVAAALGIAFRRLSLRALAGAPEEAPREPEPAGQRRRPGGGRRGRGGRRPMPEAPRRHEPRRHEAGPVVHAGEAHTTPHDELVQVVRELAQRSPNGAVLIDTLERTLKARGFSRPPGSPRLITRLRRIKELAVSSTGMITLAGEAAHAAPVAVAPGAGRETDAGALPRRGRRRRRGGRGRRRTGATGAASA